MDKFQFVKKLKEISDEFGADAEVKINLVNPKGSPLLNANIDTLDEKLLRGCRIASAIIVPKICEEDPQDGETTVSDYSGEVG